MYLQGSLTEKDLGGGSRTEESSQVVVRREQTQPEGTVWNVDVPAPDDISPDMVQVLISGPICLSCLSLNMAFASHGIVISQG